MASHLERELAFDGDDDDDAADNRYQIQEEVVLHVSLRPKLVKRMAALYQLIKPTFVAYYHLMDFLEEARGTQDHFEVNEVASKLGQSYEQVKRIFAKLKSWQTLSHCQTHPDDDCYQLDTETNLSQLVIHIKEFVV